MKNPLLHCFVILNGFEPGRSIDLDASKAPLRVGRGTECEVRLDDDEASRVHCQLTIENGQWRIEDLGSMNGTLLNSSAIQRAVVTPGDLVRVGETMLLFGQVDSPSTGGLKPSFFSDDTRVRRITGAEQRRVADVSVHSESTSDPTRKLAFLYRLSKEIYQAENIESLVNDALLSITQILGAKEAKICLRTGAGRLKQFSSNSNSADGAANLLSNWVMEKDESVLIDVDEDTSWRGPEASVDHGTAIGVPIPGRSNCIGAIESFGPQTNRFFDVNDLHFLVAVGQHLGFAIESIQQRDRVRLSNQQLRNRLGETKATLIGENPSIVQLRRQITRVASADVTTLVLGESGTGKEVASQMIHELSSRSEGPFVASNCAAFNDSLLESELFGHEKGAFTGADTRRKGRFELADKGTIFLDEIGEMSTSCQAKLLRLLEGQPFQRVGGSEPIEVDVRIVAATHRDLETMVRKGDFREDLWYRLRVVELNMPRLADRGEDILLLADYFLDKLRRELGHGPTRMSSDSANLLLRHSWPGNVRELRNAIERALVLATGEEIEPDDLGVVPTSKDSPVSNSMQNTSFDEAISLATLEQIHIQRILEMTGGNKTQACEVLGITRASLYNKLKRREKQRLLEAQGN